MKRIRILILLPSLTMSLGACHSTAEQAPAASAASPTKSQLPGPPGNFRRIFADVATTTMPSVVSIVSERAVAAPQNPFGSFGGMDPFEFFFHGPRGRIPGPEGQGPQESPPSHEFHESGLGSGFIANDEGYIVTNNHVVEGAQTLKVELLDERVFDAEVVGVDEPTDLAVIKLKEKPDSQLVPLEFGDSEDLAIGEWVVAVGAPFGLNESVTCGIISAKGRHDTGISAYGRFLQTDAAINPGNSGGPLVNLSGEVVGINTAIYSQTGGYQGIGFAIPSNLAKEVMQQLIKHGKVVRGWLGVSIQSISPDMAEALGLESRKGALVGAVLPDGPAAKAGIQRGDVIVRVGGAEVRDANDLMNRIALLAPGTKTELELLRDGKKQTVEVEIAKRNETAVAVQSGAEGSSGTATQVSQFGLELSDLSDEFRARYQIGEDVKQGAVVTDVDPTGIAARAGLEEGDVIIEASKNAVTSASDLAQVLLQAKAGKHVLLLVAREGTTFFAVLKAP